MQTKCAFVSSRNCQYLQRTSHANLSWRQCTYDTRARSCTLVETSSFLRKEILTEYGTDGSCMDTLSESICDPFGFVHFPKTSPSTSTSDDISQSNTSHCSQFEAPILAHYLILTILYKAIKRKLCLWGTLTGLSHLKTTKCLQRRRNLFVTFAMLNLPFHSKNNAYFHQPNLTLKQKKYA